MAVAGALIFPQIEVRAAHALERLPLPEALALILPHAIEQWDRPMIPGHLALLNRLVRTSPAYRLRLGPDTSTLPAVLASVVTTKGDVTAATTPPANAAERKN